MYNNKLNAKQLTENVLHVETEQQPVVLLRVSQGEPYPGSVCVCASRLSCTYGVCCGLVLPFP